MLLRDFISSATEALSALYPGNEARAMTDALCSHFLDVKPYTHVIEPEKLIDPSMENVLSDALSRLLSWEPLQYVVGKVEFAGHVFNVSPEVLIPRPETEELCSIVAGSYGPDNHPSRVLDLCTGSGCIAWTLNAAFPEAEVIAVDISESALSVASSQIQDYVGKRPDFLRSDVLAGCPEISGEFDLMVTNPPYVTEAERHDMRRNVLDYEPSSAIFPEGDDPLVFYRKTADIFKRLSSASALCFMEINDVFAKEVTDIFRQSGICCEVEVIKDIYGKNRFVKAVRQAF